ncbi:MAG TPA: hypothetical protein VHZ02_00600 [Acidimicrobiales bacterium]|nr:hypothetical protein [Acidimicrobiales bacterium]
MPAITFPILLAATAMASCAQVSTSAPVARMQIYTVGPLGHHMQIAAETGQTVPRATVRGPLPDGYVPDGTSYAYTLNLPGSGQVAATVTVSPSLISAARSHRIIYGFYNNIPERLTTWRGLPADAGIVPCSTPAGSCPGYIGGITVLKDNTLYNVFVDGVGSRAAAAAVIKSFNIAS